MKKIIKIAGYLMATVLVFIMSQTTAFAADGNNTSNGSLSSAQVVGGLSILLLVILIPTIQRERKSAN